MIKLEPFAPVDVEVFAAAIAEGEYLRLQFELRDPLSRALGGPREGQAAGWPRADGLWQTTCFECFVARACDQGYWEINLSPGSHRWAAYRFESYRTPQPPQPAEDIEMKSVMVTARSLACRLHFGFGFTDVVLNLTAVVRTAAGNSYFALKHRPERADFHWREGFVHAPKVLR